MRNLFEKEKEIAEDSRRILPMNIQLFAEPNEDPDDVEDLEEEEEVEEEEEDKKGGNQAKGSGKGSDKSGKNKSGKTFTQDQVTRMMTREKNQGKAAALRELGIDPKDSKAIAMVKAIIDSQKSDEQKKAEEESENQQKIREASERALKAECKAEAMALGAKKEFVDDVVVLVMAKYEEGAELSTLVGEVKTKYKNFFDGEEEDDDKSTGKKGTGSSIKKDKGGKKGEETKSLGSRLAAQRVGTAKKTSNFMKRT